MPLAKASGHVFFLSPKAGARPRELKRLEKELQARSQKPGAAAGSWRLGGAFCRRKPGKKTPKGPESPVEVRKKGRKKGKPL